MIKKHNKILILYFTCFLLIFFHDSFSQEVDWNQREIIWQKTDSLIKNYQELMEYKDFGNLKITDDKIQIFKNLFAPEAKIFDEIIPAYFEGDKVNPLGSKFRSVDDFLEKIRLWFPAGITAQAINISYDFSNISSRKSRVVMQKYLSGISSNGFQLIVNDTIQIEVSYSESYDKAMISKIVKVGSQLKILNDEDKDFIPDINDKCPHVAGTLDYDGCPPPQEPATYFGISASKSLSAKAQVQDFGLASMQYDNLVTSESTISEVGTDSKLTDYFGINATYEQYYGRTHMIGFGAGISYSHFASQLMLEEFDVKFRSTDFYTTPYKRIITLQTTLRENVQADYFRVPVYVAVRIKATPKIGLFLSAGFGIDFMISSNSAVSGSFNYEAIYSFSNGHPDFSESADASDWIITQYQVNKLNGFNTDSTNNYFDEHLQHNFDVAANREPDASSKFKLSPGLFYEIKGGGWYSISSNVDLSLALGYLKFSNSVKTPEFYELTNKTGEYNSIISGGKKFNWNAFNINIGVIVALK